MRIGKSVHVLKSLEAMFPISQTGSFCFPSIFFYIHSAYFGNAIIFVAAFRLSSQNEPHAAASSVGMKLDPSLEAACVASSEPEVLLKENLSALGTAAIASPVAVNSLQGTQVLPEQLGQSLSALSQVRIHEVP